MTDLKICTKCNIAKEPLLDFYICSGKLRSECKMCSIKRNISYQKKVRFWKFRFVNDDARRIYMRSYYSKNKEKFAKYREDFREKYPGYHRDYSRNRKVK